MISGEAIAAATIAALAGVGGPRVLYRLTGSERKRSTWRYYQDVIDGLEKENRRLRRRLREVEKRQGVLEETVRMIYDGDLPPEFV